MIETTGIEAVGAKLDLLGKKVATTIGKRALRAGAKITLKAAQAAAPFRTGLLRSSLKIKSQKAPSGTLALRMSMSKAIFKGGGKWYYGSFLIHGWFAGKRPGRGKSLLRALAGKSDGRRFIPPNNFLDRAFQATAAEAGEAIEAKFTELVEEAMQ